MKKFILGLLIGLLIAVPLTAYASADAIKLIINGIDFTPTMDVKPQIIDGHTMLPARYVAEELGATVKWDEGNRAVVVTSDTSDYWRSNDGWIRSTEGFFKYTSSFQQLDCSMIIQDSNIFIVDNQLAKYL